jgi:hypothetical protein
MPERLRRIALNEARFREINEKLRESLEALADAPERLSFVCECGHAACRQSVEVTAAAYEAVRANPRRFLVLPGHELLDTERVVGTGDGYLVVEKHAEAGPIVDSTDPRGGA